MIFSPARTTRPLIDGIVALSAPTFLTIHKEETGLSFLIPISLIKMGNELKATIKVRQVLGTPPKDKLGLRTSLLKGRTKDKAE